MAHSPIGGVVQLSRSFPGHFGIANTRSRVIPGTPGLAIRSLVWRNARRFGESESSHDNEPDASVEDCYCAHPLGAREPIFLRPFVCKRPSIHVASVDLVSAGPFTRAGRKRM